MSMKLAPVFNKVAVKHYLAEEKLIPSVIDKLFHVETIDTPYTDDQLWEMYSGPEPKLPLQPVAQGAFQPSFSRRYVPVMYALGDVIAEEHWADDQYGVIHRVLPSRGGALARAFATHKEKLAADLFQILGFGTAPVAGSPDGQPLFSTAHPISVSQSDVTASNRPSTYVDLSHTAYNAMWANLAQQPAANNYDLISNRPRLLVVNPTQRVVANQIVKGDWERGTSDRNINIAKGDCEVLVWPYFRKTGAASATGSYNAWFVIGQTHFLKWFNRTGFNLKTDYDIDVLGYKFVAFMRYVCGWTDWRGTYGSAGV